MAPPAAPAPQTVLLDTMGITELCAEEGTAIATAYMSTGREVEFWLVKFTVSDRIHLLQLHTSNLATLDPYGGRAIQHFPEVVCSHEGLVVLRLISPHKNFPTDYFVYGHRHDDDQQGRPWVIRLPMMKPWINSSNSVGILRAGAGAGDDYVVANLRVQVNPSQPWQMQAFLDRYCSRDKEWSQHKVKVKPSNLNEEEGEQKLLREWRTDQVLPCGNNCLVWGDLLQGILLCPSLLSSSYTEPELEYVRLPRDMPSAARPAAGDQQRGRPRQFRSIGCCADGELKLVNIHRSNQYSVEVGIWTLNLQARRRSWRKEPARSLNPSLWSSLTPQASSGSETLPPLFPALSRDDRNRRYILYLTVAGENKAHLFQFQIDTKTCTLIDSSSYPRLVDHRNPPYPTELYKHLRSQWRIQDEWTHVSWSPSSSSDLFFFHHHESTTIVLNSF